MADDSMDFSDSYAGSKRRSTADSEQEEDTLLQPHLSSSVSDIGTCHRCQEETPVDEGSPKKKAKCFSLLSKGNQELGLCSSTENASLSVSFVEEKKDDVKSKEGSFGVKEVDGLVNNDIGGDASSALEADKKEHLGVCLEPEAKRDMKGKALESENALEAEKRRLLGELEVGKLFGTKICSGNVSGLATNSTKIDDVKSIGGIQGHGLPVRASLKIEVIDDTALIEFPVSKTGNGNVTEDKKKGIQEEIDGKKAKRSRRKAKNAKKVSGEVERHMGSTRILEVQNGRKEGYTLSKIMYSRKELEALRYVKVGEQRKLWRDIYNGLGAAVIREYNDVGSRKPQKNTTFSSNTRQEFGRKAVSPDITGLVAERGTRNGLHVFVH